MRALPETYQITGMTLDDVIFVLENFSDIALSDVPLLIWVLPIQAQATLIVLAFWLGITAFYSLEDANAVWRGQWSYKLFFLHRFKEASKNLAIASLILLALLGIIELLLAISNSLYS